MTATPTPPAALVFDLDGTLVDSAPDLQAAANRLLAELGEKPLDLNTITSFVGNGIPTLVARVLKASSVSLSETDEQAAVKRFKDLYAEEPTERTVLYPGVREAMAAFDAAGCPLGVCTNKAETLARVVLRDVHLGEHLAVVIGGDTLATHKPHPEGLLAAIAKLGATRETAVYVGDSEVDAETAQAAGVRFALYAKGYRKSPVADLNAWVVFDDMSELVATLGFPALARVGE